MRIRLTDPSNRAALHDFLRRSDWIVDRDGDDLVAHARIGLPNEESPEMLRLYLGIWRAMHPTAAPPELDAHP